MKTEDIIASYNRGAAQYARSRTGTEDRDNLEQLASYLDPGSKVLDAGCAAGRDTVILKNMGFEVVGMDLAEELLKIALASYPDITFTLADIRMLPFSDGSFDAVWASAVLHHVGKAEMPQVLAEFGRVLTSGGILYVHTKAGKGTLTTREAIISKEEREFTLLTAGELDKLLTDAGLSKLQIKEKESRSRKGLWWLDAFYKK